MDSEPGEVAAEDLRGVSVSVLGHAEGVEAGDVEEEGKGGEAMRLNVLIGLFLIAYFIWVTYQMDKDLKAAAKKQKELEAEWNLRRAIQRRRQVWPKA